MRLSRLALASISLGGYLQQDYQPFIANGICVLFFIQLTEEANMSAEGGSAETRLFPPTWRALGVWARQRSQVLTAA